MKPDLRPLLLACAVGALAPAHAAEYLVAKTGDDANDGSAEAPFLTIGRAAQQAQPGDVVTVKGGIYREWVNPPRGGTAEAQRIVYRAAPGEDVRIVGSEAVAGWIAENGLWRRELPAAFFGAFNPFTESVRGPGSIPPAADDPNAEWGWLMYGRWAHRGDVFIDGLGLSEVETAAGLNDPMTWHVEMKPADSEIAAPETIVLRANFGDADPNAAQVEVNVRPHGFWPSTPGLGYITVRGFRVMNIASHWAPPVLPQPGAIGTNGGHHWVIENNLVRHGKTVCISIGNPDGSASQARAGRHLVRNNILRRCGQAGIAGEAYNHYSTVSGNVIEDINYRLEFGGLETAGIMLRRTLGTVIENNYVRRVRARPGSAGHGIWIGFENRHTRVSGNILSEIEAVSLFFEANRNGPNLVQNNVVLGGRVVSASSRHEAWLHNLFVDCSFEWIDQGYGGRAPVNHQRWLANVFVESGPEAMPVRSDLQVYSNLYLAGAQPPAFESDARRSEANPGFRLLREGSAVLLEFDWPQAAVQSVPLSTYQALDLPLTRPDGTLPDLGRDYFGAQRLQGAPAGPFASPDPGRNRLPVFELPESYDELR
jgi:alpha-N-arabinofuranosidase